MRRPFRYTPSPPEIRAATARIRAGWSAREAAKRRGLFKVQPDYVMPQIPFEEILAALRRADFGI